MTERPLPAARDGGTIPSVFAILYATGLRFLRLRVWVLALALPLGWAGAHLLGGGADPSAGGSTVAGGSTGTGAHRAEEAARILLGCLHHLLPPLAALFLLVPSEQAGLDVLLTRPLRWPGLVLRRWVAVLVIFGGCHLALSAVLVAGLAAAGGGPGGRVYRDPDLRLAGEPEAAGRPADALLSSWPSPVDARWLSAVEAERAWTFRFSGLVPGSAPRLRAWPLMGRVLHVRSGNKVERELSRASSVEVELAFKGSAAAPWQSIGLRELRDEGQVEVAAPPGAVGGDGRLWVRVARTNEEPRVTDELITGPAIFWFDPEGAGDPLLWRDVKVVASEIPFAANCARASVAALGELVVLTAAAAAAAALFSPGVAFGVVLTLFLCSSAVPYLRDVVDMLSRESALLLASRDHHAHRPPAAFERGLQHFLEFWIWALPDFERFHGTRAVTSGEALRLVDILRAAALGAGYSFAFLMMALPALLRREVRR